MKLQSLHAGEGLRAQHRTPITLNSPEFAPPRAARQAQFASGMTGAVLNGIQSIMDPINNSRLLELFISDFLGMTLPRTVIETKMRGFESGRETLLRELVGGLTPVYVCGWAGALVILGLEKMPFNPKKMSFRAWIDSSMLNHFAETTAKILPTIKNAKDLKEKFTTEILSKLQSTDQIPQISDYKKFLPEGGKLPTKVLKRLVSRLTSFSVFGYTPGGFLDADEKVLHKAFIEKITDYSIKEGGLSSRVVLMNSQGRARMGVGARSVNDVLSKTSYFLDEYLGRAVQDARLDTLTQFNPRHRKELYQRLFSTSRRSGLFGGLFPKATEGLLPYMYKLKISLVAIPLLSTAIFACAFAKINNWLTERRFGGRKFFPGEGIPHDLAQEIEKRAFEGKPEPSKEVLV